MRQVGGDAWGVDDIVEGQVVDEWAGFEEEGEWLCERKSVRGVQWCGGDCLGCILTWPMPPDAPATTAV